MAISSKQKNLHGLRRGVYPRLVWGQTIVEVMVSLSILVVGFMGFFTLLAQSIGASRTITDNYRATYLAVEGVEVVKNIIDTNVINGFPWNDGLSDDSYEVQYNTGNPNVLATATNPAPDPYIGAPICFDSIGGYYSHDGCGNAGAQDTPFTREVEIQGLDFDFAVPGDDGMMVKSTVRWTGRGGAASEVALEDYFYNWKP